MLSEAGRLYERSKRIKPLNKTQREKVYKSQSVTVEKTKGEKKFSPFNTVDRTSRDSYLLRVTNQPNVENNYHPKFNLVLPLDRRSTIDQAKFKRIIGLVKDEDYSIDPTGREKRCMKSIEENEHRPLTVRETHNWRKTMEHFDFTKQQDTRRLSLPRKLSIEESTNIDFMTTIQNVTESNFNNFKRFSFKSKPQKSHQFESDSGHQYLREIQTRDLEPQYDIQASNQAFAHRSMPKTMGEKRFYKYKEKIVTRFDRSDKDWHTFLQYGVESSRDNHTIDFDQTLSRRINEVHSKYPIRLSLTRPLAVRE